MKKIFTGGTKILKEGETGFGILIESDAGLIDRENKYNKQILKEAALNPAKFYENPYIFCVLQRYDVPNKNRRIYPKKNLLAAIEKYMELVRMRSAIGEVDHSDSTNVSLNNVGLHIEDIYWEGNTAMGKVLIPITPGFKQMGIVSTPADAMVNLMLYDILTGISSRAIGTLEKDGKYDSVMEDLQIMCWDFVGTPSTHNAFNRFDKEASIKDAAYEQPINSMITPKRNKLDNFMNRFR